MKVLKLRLLAPVNKSHRGYGTDTSYWTLERLITRCDSCDAFNLHTCILHWPINTQEGAAEFKFGW